MRAVLLILIGCICLAIGGVGIFVPVLPTTPFVLLAAGCFGSSSPALYQWLANTRYFGAYIRNHRDKTGVEQSVKIKSMIFLWGMLGVSIVLVDRWMVRGILALVGLAVSTHILLLKTKK